MKRLWLLMLLLPLAAVAQAAGPEATLTITPPTSNTDGTPITGTLTYNLYQGSALTVGGCTVSATAVQTGITTLTLVVTGLADGTSYCWQVTAVEGGVESAKSVTATKTFPAATPLAPGLTSS